MLDPVKGEEQRAALARLASRLGQVLFDKDGFWPGFMRQAADRRVGPGPRSPCRHGDPGGGQHRDRGDGGTKDGSLRYWSSSARTVLFSLMEIGDSLKPKAKDVNGEDRGKEGGPGVAPEDTLGKVLESPIQLGADETTGKGIVRCMLVTPASQTKVQVAAMRSSLDHRRAAFATVGSSPTASASPLRNGFWYIALLTEYRSVVLTRRILERVRPAPACGLLADKAKTTPRARAQLPRPRCSRISCPGSWNASSPGVSTASDERTAVTARQSRAGVRTRRALGAAPFPVRTGVPRHDRVAQTGC